ncbi:EmrB/QacA subfamily drug resistance transporter [Advenella kashmirensis WT001]|uniref:EmrB/QacA subfamily drug resistance transporter n=1 Tax=Advenella kashmirensis (strain DSM 17095 / LMG 22695 / WT001) TaxID=1036672 RepID=I3UDR5_ADVKW|nr:EmrB/QacA subfamily drug resistance transporter [Advenella kashmirensis WT001]
MVTRTIEVNEEKSASGRLLPFRQSLMAVLGICFVGMLVGLDQTIVGTALPTIVAELNGFELYAWVGTSYLLASVITVPICGRLSDYYGRKPFVVASVIIFTIASVLCGMAGSMTQLVLARALQGIGGGMLVGTAFACVPDLFPDAKVRLRWQILLSSSFGIASAVGPSLGGF